MTLKIVKPELNIREKLTELDYAQVPYDKMPDGSIIQQKIVQRRTDISTNASATFVDVLGFKFAPKFADSRLEFFTNLSMGATQSVGYQLRILEITSTPDIELERTGWHFQRAITADALDTRASWMHMHDPGSTEERHYKLQGYKNSTAGTVWFHTYGASATSFFGVREIKGGIYSDASSVI